MTDAIVNTNLDQYASTVDPVAVTVDIVAAYVSKNPLSAAELPSMLAGVHGAVAALSNGDASASTAEPTAEFEKPSPAAIRKSVTPDGIVSFLDGKSYKTLKRHLGVHGLDPHSYRQRYDLPSDYPMVAPSYAAQRSALAKSIGLGRPGGMAQASAVTAKAASEPKKRGRKAA